jgi:ferric iron reductase protein FhuF
MTPSFIASQMQTEPSSNLEQRIASLFVGDLRHFAGQLKIGPALPQTVRGDQLLEPGMMALIQRQFDAQCGETDPRVVVSIWAKMHFAKVLPSWMTTHLLLDWSLPIRFDEVSFGMTVDGGTTFLQVPHEGTPSIQSHDDFAPYEDLVFRHLAPCIELLSARSRVTERVFWNSASNYFEAMVLRLEPKYGDRASMISARRLINSPCLADGRANPLFRPVTYEQEGYLLVRRRRVCCMRYRVPDGIFCKNCPSPLRSPAQAQTPYGSSLE